MMQYPLQAWISAAALGVFLSGVACAGSVGSAGSSASSAGSVSLKGSSASIETSSDGVSSVSSKDAADKTALVETGAYRITAVEGAAGAAAAEADTLRLSLAPEQMPHASPFVLRVPAAAFDQAPPQAGERIHAQRRDYGVQFSRLQGEAPGQAFFLVLADAWQRDLNSRPVTP